MELARIPWKIRYDLGRRLGSRARRLAVEITHRHCTVRFGEGCTLGPGFQLTIPGHGQLIVGDDVEFRRGFTAEIAGNGRVTIGDGCKFTWDTVIQCTTTIDIGPGSWIGRVLIVDGNHRFRDPTKPVSHQGYDFRHIKIGPEALIANNAVVMNDVGERAFVGANAVVTKPVPPFTVAVGAPARVIEYFGPPRDEEPAVETGR